MQVLSEPEKYYQLQRCVKEASGGTSFGNCYLTADVLTYYVSKGAIRYFLFPGGVAFLIDRGTTEILQLCVGETASLELPPQEKPLVAELVYRAGKVLPGQREAEELLIRAGMSLRKELYEYTIGTLPEKERQRHQKILREFQSMGYRFEPVDAARAREAHLLLEAAIDPFDLRGFEEMRWEDLCANRQAFCTVSPQGKICAVCVLPTGFRGGLTAVDAKFRGKGLGRIITYYSYHVAAALFPNERIWIAFDNSINQHIVTTMGSRDTLRRTKQYVIQGGTQLK